MAKSRGPLMIALGVVSANMIIACVIIFILLICFFVFMATGQSPASVGPSRFEQSQRVRQTAMDFRARLGELRGTSDLSSRNLFRPIGQNRPEVNITDNLFMPVQRNFDTDTVFRSIQQNPPPQTDFANNDGFIFGGYVKIDPKAPCYLTGQPMISCQCEECKQWRAKHAH